MLKLPREQKQKLSADKQKQNHRGRVNDRFGGRTGRHQRIQSLIRVCTHHVFVSERVSLLPNPSEAKVENLEQSILRDAEVARLQVSARQRNRQKRMTTKKFVQMKFDSSVRCGRRSQCHFVPPLALEMLTVGISRQATSCQPKSTE